MIDNFTPENKFPIIFSSGLSRNQSSRSYADLFNESNPSLNDILSPKKISFAQMIFESNPISNFINLFRVYLDSEFQYVLKFIQTPVEIVF